MLCVIARHRRAWRGAYKGTRRGCASLVTQARELLGGVGEGEVTLEKDAGSGVATITLRNEKRKNALSGERLTQRTDVQSMTIVKECKFIRNIIGAVSSIRHCRYVTSCGGAPPPFTPTYEGLCPPCLPSYGGGFAYVTACALRRGFAPLVPPSCSEGFPSLFVVSEW